jgi:dTDP-4-amino-4,6-dideoxygalactose transaminase
VKYQHEAKGFNSRLDELQAAFLREKLLRLDEWNARRKEVAQHYLTAFADSNITAPFVPAWADPVWHLFVIRSHARDQLQKALSEAGIGTVIHYPTPPHLQAAYAELGFGPGAFPIAEKIHREVISLPISPHLDQAQATEVVAAIKRCG